MGGDAAMTVQIGARPLVSHGYEPGKAYPSRPLLVNGLSRFDDREA